MVVQHAVIKNNNNNNMNEKKIKSLLSTFGMSEAEQTAFIADLKDEQNGDFATEKEFLLKAKEYGLKVSQSDIEKRIKEEKKGAVDGAILKSLTAVWKNLKSNGETTSTFDEWKKTVEGKDYAEVIEEHITNARSKSISSEQAVKALNEKIKELSEKYNEKEREFETYKNEISTKERNREIDTKYTSTVSEFKKKPISNKTYNDFKRMINDDYGYSLSLDEKNNLSLVDKNNSIAIKDGKIVTLDGLFEDYATKYPHEFIVSNGGTNVKTDDSTTTAQQQESGAVKFKSGQSVVF